MKLLLTVIISLVVSFTQLSAQSSFSIPIQLKWNSNPIIHSITEEQPPLEIWNFKGAILSSESPSIPAYIKTFPLSGYSNINANLRVIESSSITIKEAFTQGTISNDFQIITSIEKDRNQYIGKVLLLPIRKLSTNSYEKLEKAQIDIRISPKALPNYRGPITTTISALADGELYKIAVEEEGMHQLSYTFLKDELNINIDNVNPNTIKIYGAGGGPLPELLSLPRTDDLKEVPVYIEGGEDGSFDATDQLIFYAEGPNTIQFNQETQQFDYIKNVYDNRNYYFIKISAENRTPITTQNTLNNTVHTVSGFDAIVHYEEDKFNLLHDYQSGQGAGQDWFGDLFEGVRERNYENFNFPNIDASTPARVKVEFAGRSDNSSRFEATLNNTTLNSSTILSTNTGNVESTYAYIGRVNTLIENPTASMDVTINYLENSTTSEGWLDFIEIHARRQLQMTGDQLIFRDTNSTNYASSTFRLSNANTNTLVWDITSPLSPIQMETNLNGTELSFGCPTEQLRTFIAFDPSSTLLSPIAIGAIENQNLHALDNIDLLIVYPTLLQVEAEQFANHRRQYSGLEVATVALPQIYNEFSSGRLDPTAIRDLAKMLHDRTDRFKYLLLFGDGSFDARGIYSFEERSDLVPVYETPNSLQPINSYPADDYFALLSDDEGEFLQGALDIAVGRFPVKTSQEARLVINKIIDYDTNPEFKGDWQNRVVYVADDEDNNLHLRDADGIAEMIDTSYQHFNLDKIYLDAFQQVSTPGGEKYPEVTEAINKTLFKGALVVNYLGHGGAKGWTQERVLDIQNIESWTNAKKLPLFVTATCSFSGYDDPAFVTAGERTILQAGGGTIGLFTTVRAVYASTNEELTRAVFEQIFEKDDVLNSMPIGEILRRAKNSNSGFGFTNNSRKFTLLGDPSMRLAIPKYSVETTFINGQEVSDESLDTLNALQTVQVRGKIVAPNGNLIDDFNGQIFPTIYDKYSTITTLGQDQGSSPTNFQLQKNVLFKGVASVSNGEFEFSFVIPKDINYNFGEGKISYYAKDDQLRDAAGFYDKIIIGGTSTTANNDQTGPSVEVFMNNENFVFGGVTSENPVLYIKLSDDNGINVAGNSIGHDLSATLDENTQQTYLLNDFYEAALDDYTKGVVKFPLFDIEEGRHSVAVEAWDVANNAAKGYTEFVVAKSEQAALAHVLNYPNPFTTSTQFQFEHNLPDQLLNVQVRIFTVSGRLVKTIEQQVLSDGYRVTDVHWNGTDDFGDQLARGVYLYKIKINSGDETSTTTANESDFEKLVILK